MRYPNFREEKRLKKQGFKIIVGLDEAGRGALAGSVAATAVVILKFPKSNSQFFQIKDSKKLTPKKRDEFYKILTEDSKIEWATGWASEKVIDKINVLGATKLAMKRAVKNLRKKLKHRIDFLILDGNITLSVSIPQKSIPKADNKVFSCAAASIIAKVKRDRAMKRYHEKYSKYGFDKHKGYATEVHRKMLKKYKPCQIHRKTFKPVMNCLKVKRSK